MIAIPRTHPQAFAGIYRLPLTFAILLRILMNATVLLCMRLDTTQSFNIDWRPRRGWHKSIPLHSLLYAKLLAGIVACFLVMMLSMSRLHAIPGGEGNSTTQTASEQVLASATFPVPKFGRAGRFQNLPANWEIWGNNVSGIGIVRDPEKSGAWAMRIQNTKQNHSVGAAYVPGICGELGDIVVFSATIEAEGLNPICLGVSWHTHDLRQHDIVLHGTVPPAKVYTDSSVFGTVNSRRLTVSYAITSQWEVCIPAVYASGIGIARFSNCKVAINDKPLDEILLNRHKALLSKGLAALLQVTTSMPIGQLLEGETLPTGVRKVVEGAQFVGIGQASHGTRELIQLRTALIGHLVRSRKGTIIALEASPAAVARINVAIQDPNSDVKSVVEAAGWLEYRSAEFVQTVSMIRALKHSGFDVSIWGVSVSHLGDLCDVIEKRVALIDAAYVQRLREIYLPIKRFQANPEDWIDIGTADAAARRLGKDKIADLALQAEMVFAHLYGSRRSYLKGHPAPIVNELLYYARVLPDIIRNWAVDDEVWRDRCLAQNVRYLSSTIAESASVIICAHNAHVSMTKQRMGCYLREWYGQNYFALASTFGQGSYSAMKSRSAREFVMESYSASPLLAGSIESYCELTTFPCCFLDLKQLRIMSKAKELRERPMLMRLYGSLRDNSDWHWHDVVSAFDGLVYLRNGNSLK